MLNNVTYAAANQGLVKYIADGEQPSGPQEVEVKVGAMVDEDFKEGRGKVVVKGSIYSIDIEIPEPALVWPTLPGGDEQNSNNRNVQDSIKFKLLKNKKPFVDQIVNVSIRMILPSGGHDHTNQPPPNLMGQFQGQNQSTINFNVTTNDSGKCFLRYTAPAFGGLFELKAIKILHAGTEDVDTLRAVDTLTVMVPGLVELGDGQGVYELVGTPNNHAGTNDPCRPTPPTSLHNNNHFGTQDLVDAVTDIAVSYYSLHPAVRLRINDMSLEYGGLFDINNNWSNPHNTHRLGQNVDIGLNGINFNNQCISINQIHMNQIIDDFAVRIIEGDHYHITAN